MPGYYDNSLKDDRWIVVAPKKKHLWKMRRYLKEFCDHLLRIYPVQNSKFVLHGHSNGGSAVLRFACEHPGLCCGVVAVAAGSIPFESFVNLSGIPVAQYFGDNDSQGFTPQNRRLAANLEGHLPWSVSNEIKRGGHNIKALRDGAGKRGVHDQIARMCIVGSGIKRKLSDVDDCRAVRPQPSPAASRAVTFRSWRHFPGRNAYPGKGGTWLAGEGDATTKKRGCKSLRDAQLLCLAKGAKAFTFDPAKGFVWLLSHVDINRASRGSKYDMHAIEGLC